MTTTIDGITLRYATQGEGPDVILLHGWGGKLESMSPAMLALRDRYRVSALDFPAHGESGCPPEPWGVDEFADLTLKWMDELGIKRCHVLAHSFGARVTISMAARRPERFDKLVLTGAAGVKLPATLGKRLRGAAKDLFVKVAPQKVREALRDRFSSPDYRQLDREMQKTFVKVVEQDLRPYLSKIQSPTLLIWGELDTDTPLEMGRIMEQEIPGAGLVVFEGAGHFAYLEQSQRFLSVASYFLDH